MTANTRNGLGFYATAAHITAVLLLSTENILYDLRHVIDCIFLYGCKLKPY